MRAKAVIGACYGDEGKGLTVDYICAKGDAGVVVRFNGGAQAGHTVVTPAGERHVFRQLGSGTFCGVPTFLSQFVSVNPISLLMELKQLSELGYTPEVYASPECLVTTFADMIINRRIEDARSHGRHGSCGMGISETIDRSRITELKITMADIYSQANLESKIEQICDRYARFRTGQPIAESKMGQAFLQACRRLPEVVSPAGIGQCKDPVFEGAQGLLLSEDNKANFPHVTRSNTGSKNVRLLCATAGISDIDVYYVTRTYLSKHGAGPLPGEDPGLCYEDETNKENQYQGKIRFAPLDKAALYDRTEEDGKGLNCKLVVTHRDQEARRDVESDLSCWGPTREDFR